MARNPPRVSGAGLGYPPHGPSLGKKRGQNEGKKGAKREQNQSKKGAKKGVTRKRDLTGSPNY